MEASQGHFAATNLLARMLTGIAATNLLVDPDQPDLAASTIEADGETAVQAKIHLPPGDTYLIRVEWVKEESP